MNWLVKKIFKQRYKFFEYPFESADYKIMKKNSDEREKYYREAKTIVESECFKTENEEIVRKFYQELALGQQKTDYGALIDFTSKEKQTAYRLCLLFMQRYEKRMKYLAEQHNEIYKLNKKYGD